MKWTDEEKRWLKTILDKNWRQAEREFEETFGYRRSGKAIIAMRRYETNPDANKKIKRRAMNRSRLNMDFIHKYKSENPCEICGEKEPVALDFHHRNPDDKDFNISKGTRDLDKLQNEIEKCAVLCANCHRKVHAGILSLE